jgi:hypothetical protein
MSYDPNQPYGGYGQPPQQPLPPYQPPQYGAPPMVYMELQSPPQKSSLAWLWIMLGILGGVLLLICGGCFLLSMLGTSNLINFVSSPMTTVDNYYTAVQSQDYATAYSYLSVDTLSLNGQRTTASESSYEQIATTLDNQRGLVTAYAVTSSNVSGDTATITVHVTRAGGNSYNVTLRLAKIGSDWKITDFDNI